MLDRRHFGLLTIAASATQFLSRDLKAEPRSNDIGYGFSLYGMKSLPLSQALQVCADLGYNSVEIPAMIDWPSSPEKLSQDARKELRSSLEEHRLRLSAIMENLVLLAEPPLHQKNLDRLKRGLELARDLSPAKRPILETVLGGKPSEWEEVKGRMVDRLAEWAKVADESKSVVAIKAHISGAAHRPEHIRWLLDQVGSPSIKAVFDFSHFQLREISLKSSWELLGRDTVFIHIKDSIGDQNKFQFALPGEGNINYLEYFQLLKESNCQADVVVEVSAQIHNRPDYDPVAAATKSYTQIAPAFLQAGIVRN